MLALTSSKKLGNSELLAWPGDLCPCLTCHVAYAVVETKVLTFELNLVFLLTVAKIPRSIYCFSTKQSCSEVIIGTLWFAGWKMQIDHETNLNYVSILLFLNVL